MKGILLIRKAKMKEVYDYEEDVTLRPEKDPEIVGLGEQDIEEAKRIIKDAQTWEEERRQRKHEETLKNIKEACGLEGKEPRLLYDEESSDCCLPDLNEARETCGFRRDVDVFALWRRLADVKVGRPELEPQIFCPTKDLMDYILMKLNKVFPKLKLSWSEDTWNPCLKINNCATKISMEKIALAYQGLLNVSDEMNAQGVICDIVTKKLKELFI